jgi:hypothetical protein
MASYSDNEDVDDQDWDEVKQFYNDTTLLNKVVWKFKFHARYLGINYVTYLFLFICSWTSLVYLCNTIQWYGRYCICILFLFINGEETNNKLHLLSIKEET